MFVNKQANLAPTFHLQSTCDTTDSNLRECRAEEVSVLFVFSVRQDR